MARTKAGDKQIAQRLSSYKFDSSNYIVLDTGIRRDATTGRLVTYKARTESGKPKK